MPTNPHIDRKQGEIPFKKGGTKGLKLDKTHFYEKLELLVDWDVTVNTAGTDQHANGILELIQNIELEFNNNKSPKSYSLPMVHFLNWYRTGERPRFDSLDFGTASQQTGKVQANLNMMLPSPGKRQTGTMLPGFAFSDLELRVKWATDTDIGADVTINDATVQVQSVQREKSSVKGAAKVANNVDVFYENERSQAIVQDGETTVEMPVGDTYKAVAFQVLDGDDPDASLIENIHVQDDGTNTHLDTTPDLLRNRDLQEHAVSSLAPGFGIINYGVYPDEVFNAQDRDTYEITFTTARAPTDPAKVKVVEQLIV